MNIAESAIRELLDALQASGNWGLEKTDQERSIDDNVELTGAPERAVKAYLLGLKALDSMRR